MTLLLVLSSIESFYIYYLAIGNPTVYNGYRRYLHTYIVTTIIVVWAYRDFQRA